MQPTISRFFKKAGSSVVTDEPQRVESVASREGVARAEGVEHVHVVEVETPETVDMEDTAETLGAVSQVVVELPKTTSIDQKLATTVPNFASNRTSKVPSDTSDPTPATPSALPMSLKRRSNTLAPPGKLSRAKPTAQPPVKKQKASKLTPMEQQIKDLKLQHMDKVLAVQVGYKYKFFAQDAQIVSKILHNMLLPGKLTMDDSNPDDLKYDKFAYCSIPDHRLHVHVEKLVKFGLKVGVVEQVETSAIKAHSSNKSSVFDRKVTHVYTRATYMEGGEVSKILCLVEDGTNFSMVSVEPISGEIIFDEFEDFRHNELETRIAHLQPAEVVGKVSPSTRIFLQKYNLVVTDVALLNSSSQRSEFSENLNHCIDILKQYLLEFNLASIMDVDANYKSLQSATTMLLNSKTLYSLEIFQNSTDNKEKGSLLWLLNHTRTQFGFRLLKHWLSKPLLKVDLIQERLDAIEFLTKDFNYFLDTLNGLMQKLPDLSRCMTKIAYGTCSRKDLYDFLKAVDSVLAHLKSHEFSSSSTLVTRIFKGLNAFAHSCNIQKFLDRISIDGVHDGDVLRFFNKDSYVEIEEQQAEISKIEALFEEELQVIRAQLKRPIMNYITNNKEEYLIEVRNSMVVPKDWVKINATKAVSRYRSPRTSELLKELLFHQELLVQLNNKKYKEFLVEITQDYAEISQFINNLAQYDCLLSLAATSLNVNYTRPTFVDDSGVCRFKNSRNPIIESLTSYIPNDIPNDNVMVITGPNMGGKSSYIRQVALLVIMSQIGCYVPADAAELSVFDSIFTRIGSYDSLTESTFQVEMQEVLEIINNCTANSLVLLDEVGRGTGTIDGIAISHAILQYFLEMEKCPKILFITHYPMLARIKGVVPYHMSFVESKNEGQDWSQVVFLYKLTPGVVHSSYGLNVAQLARIPDSIINEAYAVSEQKRLELEGVLELIEAESLEKKVDLLKRML